MSYSSQSFFKVLKSRDPSSEDEKWCFCIGADMTVTGIGLENKRWWDTKKELIDELTALGIEEDRYEVCDM